MDLVQNNTVRDNEGPKCFPVPEPGETRVFEQTK